MKAGKLYFRANANSQIGLGHLIRCISLIQIVQKYFDCTLIVNFDVPKKSLPNDIEYIFINKTNQEDEINVLKTYLDIKSILVLDGYNFAKNYQSKIKCFVKKIIVIDDFKNHKHNCDVVINHGVKNLTSNKSIKTFSGFDYLILRKEFLIKAKRKNSNTPNNNVVICFGGSDPYNITYKVIKALSKVTEIEKINVIIGAANIWKDKLIQQFASDKVNFFTNIPPKKIINLLDHSIIGISTSSTIALEICSTHTPLLCGWINSNQKCIDNYIVSESCGISIGNWKKASIENIYKYIVKIINPKTLQILSYNQSKKIDGKSDKRYLKIFNDLVNNE